MPDIERTADKPAVSAADSGAPHSVASLFNSAYDKVVTTVKEHPYASAAAVVGGAALIYATKGTALLSALKYESKAPSDVLYRIGGKEVYSSRLPGITNHMVGYDSFGLPPVRPKMSFDPEVAAKGALSEFERAGYRQVEARAASLTMRDAGGSLASSGVPISAEARSAAANPEILKLSPWQRPEAIRGMGMYVRGEHPAERALTAFARDGYRDVQSRQALAGIREAKVTDLPD